jgi:hypothetical protein
MDRVEVHWVTADENLVRDLRGLYRFDYGRETLLIGKADKQTPWRRWNCHSKDGFKEWALSEGISQVRPLLGEIYTDSRLTAQLLEDVEKLLIFRVQPRGNVSAKQSFTLSRRLTVRCTGLWHHKTRTFAA